MRIFCFFLLVLFGFLHPRPAGVVDTQRYIDNFDFRPASSGQDRCCNRGCVARVTPGPKEQVAKIKKITDTTDVYFDEDSSHLKPNESEKVDEFMSDAREYANITLIGYTDGCGTLSYNKALSLRRAQKVKQQILKTRPNASITIRAAGEIAEGHSAKNRKVQIAHSTNVTLVDPPPKIISDFYLVDSSSSMKGSKFEKYRRAITYHRPPGSVVYLSTTACVSNGKSYNSIDPTGGTEIWYAYWYILDRMKPGQTLTIVSDFDSTYPLTAREEMIIQQKVKSKGVIVKSISL